MNAQLNNINTKPVYFPTELWDEIKSYIPAPKDKRTLCIDTADEWLEMVVRNQSKKRVAERLRNWSSEDNAKFNDMTDPTTNRYKRTTKDEMVIMLSILVLNFIRKAFAEGGEFLQNEARWTYQRMRKELNQSWRLNA
jgi:hypothetical protein